MHYKMTNGGINQQSIGDLKNATEKTEDSKSGGRTTLHNKRDQDGRNSPEQRDFEEKG